LGKFKRVKKRTKVLHAKRCFLLSLKVEIPPLKEMMGFVEISILSLCERKAIMDNDKAETKEMIKAIQTTRCGPQDSSKLILLSSAGLINHPLANPFINTGALSIALLLDFKVHPLLKL
tara:strand:+ start:163 stop:519 length:357 start_codon:yes stop_codon:yes gene_type:complete